MNARRHGPTNLAGLIAAFWLSCLSNCLADPPQIISSSPSALQWGSSSELIVRGKGLQNVTGLWTSFPIVTEATGPADAQRARFRVRTEAPPGSIGLLRVLSADGLSNLLPVMVDELPTLVDNDANHTPAAGQWISLPAAVDGLCQSRQADYYRLRVRAGERLQVDVLAARLGSELDPLIRLLDEQGRELAYCDDGPHSPDPELTYSVESDGELLLELRDTRYDGGSNHRYRLRASLTSLASPHFLPLAGTEVLATVTESEPNDDRTTATTVASPTLLSGTFDRPGDTDYLALNVEKETRWVITGRTRSLGSPCDLYLELLTHAGKSIAKANVRGSDEGTLTNTFLEAGTYLLRIEELSRLGGPDLRYQIQVEPQPPGFELKVDTDRLQASPGADATFKVTVLRRDYTGPILLSWVHGPEGFSTQTIPEKEGAIEWQVNFPATVRPGQWFNVRLEGQAQIGERTFVSQAHTTAAIKKLFPVLLYPPTEFDGLITLGVLP